MCFYNPDCVFFHSSGGWWSVGSFGEITGTVAIEMQNNSYIHALDTGLFTVGAPHKGRDFGGPSCGSITRNVEVETESSSPNFG